jgi:hypothetical protein
MQDVTAWLQRKMAYEVAATVRPCRSPAPQSSRATVWSVSRSPCDYAVCTTLPVQTADGRQQYINVGKYVKPFFFWPHHCDQCIGRYGVLISDRGSCRFGVVYPGCCKLQASDKDWADLHGRLAGRRRHASRLLDGEARAKVSPSPAHDFELNVIL